MAFSLSNYLYYIFSISLISLKKSPNYTVSLVYIGNPYSGIAFSGSIT